MNGQDLLDETWWTALSRCAASRRHTTAMHFEGSDWEQSLTFGDWHAQAERAAAALQASGVTAGDTVAVLCPGSAVWPVLQVACSRLGAVIVPINSRYKLDELSFVLGLTRPKLMFFIEAIRDEPLAPLLVAALRAVDGLETSMVRIAHPRVSSTEAPTGGPPQYDEWSAFLDAAPSAPRETSGVLAEDPVLMQFTSGTTAFPKGALLNSAATLRATFELGGRMGLTPEDVMYSTQPMYHVGGSVATTLMALTIGCTMLVPERYTPSETFRLVRKHGATARTGQAAMYAMELAHADFSPSTFATVEKGWAGGTAELKAAVVERMGITGLVSMYGLTEAAASTTACRFDDPLEMRLASCGRALPGIEVGILRDGVVTVDAGAPGEICVRGWSLMVAYYADAAATSKTIDGDGWLHTGDLGRLDEHGNLYFVDRLKEMIKPGGENVAPAEIERVIAAIDGVNQVAVVGMPDARLGEVPVAFVEQSAPAQLSEEDITSVCAQRMASFKVPRRVIFVSQWPMTESGKILKPALRASLAGEGSGLVGQSG